MAGSLFYLPQQHELDTNGENLAGGLLYFYVAGTTTPKDTYQDTGLTTAHANPVVADSDGRWDPIYLDGSYKITLKDADGNEIWTEDDISGVTVPFGGTIAITSSTPITSTHQNKHLRVTGTSSLTLLAASTAGDGFTFSFRNDGTGLVTIDPNASEEANDTTTWVIPPQGSGIAICNGSEWSIVGSLGIPQSLAAGDVLYFDANKQLSRLAKGNNGQYLSLASGIPAWANIVFSKGADVASAGALTLGTDGNFFDITGTTNITSIGTLGVGTVVILQFDGALTLTDDDDNIVLNTGGSNILTAAGDYAVFIEHAAGKWTLLSYSKYSGNGNTYQYLTSGTAATYTTPAGCIAILVKMVGGGGGGGSSNATPDTGDAGGTTTFNSINAVGGAGGVAGATPSGGYATTPGTGSASLRIIGAAGTGSGRNGAIGAGGSGGPGPWGGRGNSGQGDQDGNDAPANSGGGGGGAGSNTQLGGGGGQAGEYVEIYIANPSATYTYTVGAGGVGGDGASFDGGNGGSGLIIVEEYYK